MNAANQVIAFDGLDEAILGTCSRGSEGEVVAYDFNKVVELFENMGWSEEMIEEWLSTMAESIPEEAFPVFVYLDDTVKNEIAACRGTTH